MIGAPADVRDPLFGKRRGIRSTILAHAALRFGRRLALLLLCFLPAYAYAVDEDLTGTIWTGYHPFADSSNPGKVDPNEVGGTAIALLLDFLDSITLPLTAYDGRPGGSFELGYYSWFSEDRQIEFRGSYLNGKLRLAPMRSDIVLGKDGKVHNYPVPYSNASCDFLLTDGNNRIEGICTQTGLGGIFAGQTLKASITLTRLRGLASIRSYLPAGGAILASVLTSIWLAKYLRRRRRVPVGMPSGSSPEPLAGRGSMPKIGPERVPGLGAMPGFSPERLMELGGMPGFSPEQVSGLGGMPGLSPEAVPALGNRLPASSPQAAPLPGAIAANPLAQFDSLAAPQLRQPAAPAASPAPHAAGLPPDLADEDAPTNLPEEVAPLTRGVGQPGRDDKTKQTQDPWIRATLNVSNSARCMFGECAPGAIWGDGVDLVFVGYALDVAPGWNVVPGTETHEFFVQNGVTDETGDYQVMWNEVGVPAEERKAVVTANWSLKDTSLTIALSVSAKITDGLTPPRLCTSSGTLQTTTLRVVGAKPYLELLADCDGYADGNNEVHIVPFLTLFEIPYSGGVASTFPAMKANGNPVRLETYFEPIANMVATDKIQHVILRCKFHLDDPAMQALPGGGCAIEFKVHPTGDGPEEGRIFSSLDYMAGKFYQACKAQMSDDYPVESAQFNLYSAKITVTFPGQPSPPTTLSESAEHPELSYRLRVNARVVARRIFRDDGRLHTVTDDDQVIFREFIVRDKGQPAYWRWSMAFNFKAPDDATLEKWDPKGGNRSFNVVNLSDTAELMFSAEDIENISPGTPGSTDLVYDHWREYFDVDRRYLSGQCCDLQITFYAGGDPIQIARIYINPPSKLYIYAAEQGATGHAFLSLVNGSGVRIFAGFYPGVLLLPPVRATTAFEFGATSTVVLSGMAAILFRQLCLRLGVGLLVGMPVVALGVLAAGVAGGFLAVGEDVSYSLGQMNDDFEHELSVCHAWDITPKEYDSARERITHFKKLADSHEMLYEFTGIAHGSRRTFDRGCAGNCLDFVLEIYRTIKISEEILFSVSGAYSPSSLATRLKAAARPEINNDDKVRAINFKHPWIYDHGNGLGRGPTTYRPLNVFGTWPPPKVPEQK